MAPVIRTVYSNVVEIQTSETELILQFGTHFPVTEGPVEESQQYSPEVRVVVPKKGAERLITAIQEALALESEKPKDASNESESKPPRRKAK